MFMVVSCLHYPKSGMAFAALILVGRLAFSIGYEKYGPKGRLCGALLGDLGILGSFAMSLATIHQIVTI